MLNSVNNFLHFCKYFKRYQPLWQCWKDSCGLCLVLGCELHACRKEGWISPSADQMLHVKKNRIQNPKPKRQKEKVCKEFASQFGVGFTTNSKRTQHDQNNLSFVIVVSKENSIMGTELEILPFIWKGGEPTRMKLNFPKKFSLPEWCVLLKSEMK